MKININDKERIARGVGGAILTSLAFVGPANPLFLIGLIPLTTGILGVCPLYSGLHVSSTKSSEPKYFHAA